MSNNYFKCILNKKKLLYVSVSRHYLSNCLIYNTMRVTETGWVTQLNEEQSNNRQGVVLFSRRNYILVVNGMLWKARTFVYRIVSYIPDKSPYPETKTETDWLCMKDPNSYEASNEIWTPPVSSAKIGFQYRRAMMFPVCFFPVWKRFKTTIASGWSSEHFPIFVAPTTNNRKLWKLVFCRLCQYNSSVEVKISILE